jgi:UDP-N-acetyl-2-amino-2-deoxyglucuronate dehydrogenase
VILEQDRIVAADLRSPEPILNPSSAGDQNRSASSAVVSDFRGHQEIIKDFIHAIESNSTPTCDGLEGRRSIALIEAIYRAARHPAISATA